MALISCKECGHKVSDLASACPECGAPVATKSIQTPIQTIQKTSKSLKLQRLYANIFFIVGLIMLIFNLTYAGQVNKNPSSFIIVFFLVSLVWLIAVRMRVWWHHE